MWPHDGLTPTVRNLVFLVTTATIYSCLLYSWLDLEKHVREEALYLSLFILGTLALATTLGLALYDSFTNRDIVKENDLENQRKEAVDNFKKSNRFTNEELENINNSVSTEKKYHGNSFDGGDEIWRTLLVAVLAITTFVSFVVIYDKHSKETKEEAGYIILISVATLAMAAHVLMLIFQLVHRRKISLYREASIKNNEDLARKIEAYRKSV